MRILIAVLLSVALFQAIPAEAEHSDINNIVRKQANVEQARKSATEDVATLQEKTPEPVENLSEPVAVTSPSVKAEEPTPPPVTPATGCEKYRSIIAQYSWNVDVAIAVCNAESSGNANTSNMNDYHSFAHCRGSFGLFQINCSHGIVHDPVKNIAIAAKMYDARGWQPWSATTCKYKVKCY